MKLLKRLALAFAFMTRVPIPINFKPSERDIAQMVVFFPVTSLFIGAVMYGGFYITGLLGFKIFPVLAALMINVLMTGALHIDGFIDCADAFFVSKSKQRALDILKDSRVGAYGVIACVLLFIIKFTLLVELDVFRLSYLFVFLAMPVAGKIPLLICAYFSTYARQEGKGKSVITLSKWGEVLFALMMSFAALVLMFGLNGLYLSIALVSLGFIYVLIGKAKIGGATGDLLGSTNESGEMVFLILLFILLKFGG